MSYIGFSIRFLRKIWPSYNSITLYMFVCLWRHNDHDCVSNHQPRGCLLNRLFRRRSKKTSKLRVTGLCAGNSPGTGEFPAQMASNAENVSIWWRHHGYSFCLQHNTLPTPTATIVGYNHYSIEWIINQVHPDPFYGKDKDAVYAVRWQSIYQSFICTVHI